MSEGQVDKCIIVISATICR